MTNAYPGIAVTDNMAGQNACVGVSIAIPGTEQAIQLIHCNRGILCCGVLSHEVMEALDASVCLFRAPEIQDILIAKPIYVSPKARELGASEELTGQEIMALFA